MFTLFDERAEIFFENHVGNSARSVDEGFEKVQAHVLTPASTKEHLKNWNTLKFSDIASLHQDKPMADLLDMLSSEARGLKALLWEPYNNKRMLGDFLERACEDENFIRLRPSRSYTDDPDECLFRLHLCISDMPRCTDHILKFPQSDCRFKVPHTTYMTLMKR